MEYFATNLFWLGAGFMVWLGALATYRLYLSPLASFPGPKLAALTGWYETYYDCMKDGTFWIQIEQFHKRYGPIVRISPWELHVNDPDWNEPYKMSSRANKYHWYYRFVGSSDSAFGTADYDAHRLRRGAQQGYFTQASVARFDPTLDVIVEKLVSRLRDLKGTGQVVNLSNACRSLAVDVVTEFSFRKSYNQLSSPDFAADSHKTLREFPRIGMWHRHFGLILDVFQALPPWFVRMINPAGVDVVNMFLDVEERTSRILVSHNTEPAADPNIITYIYDSPDLPPSDKSAWRLALEMRTLIGAGTETTGNMLSATTFYLLSNPDKAQRLKDEIQTARKGSKVPLGYQALQQLPYLTAVISEGLRISTSVAGRLPRINTHSALKYDNWTIPAGTPVSTTQKLTHDNHAIFPRPREFIPERWLDCSPAERKRMEKYLQPFGRGSRACLGQYLALSEIHVYLARVFGEFKMTLFETTEEDVEQVHDYFSPFPTTATGVRVIVE